MYKKPTTNRIGPITAIIGAVLLFIGTYLHPMDADPNISLAAFTEYAADRHWVASHLLQLFGVISMAAALVLLSRRLADGPAASWAALGMVGAVASLAMASALQAASTISAACDRRLPRTTRNPFPNLSFLCFIRDASLLPLHLSHRLKLTLYVTTS